MNGATRQVRKLTPMKSTGTSNVPMVTRIQGISASFALLLTAFVGIGCTAPTLTPTSTDFVAGDRIVIAIYNDDGNGVTEASGRNWTLDYNAGAGVDGDTYLSFTETIGFNADSNNAPARTLTSYALFPVSPRLRYRLGSGAFEESRVMSRERNRR